MNTINFTAEKFNKFKLEYKNAVDSNLEMFMFEDCEILTTYAKYMIEHLKPKFP